MDPCCWQGGYGNFVLKIALEVPPSPDSSEMVRGHKLLQRLFHPRYKVRVANVLVNPIAMVDLGVHCVPRCGEVSRFHRGAAGEDVDGLEHLRKVGANIVGRARPACR